MHGQIDYNIKGTMSMWRHNGEKGPANLVGPIGMMHYRFYYMQRNIDSLNLVCFKKQGWEHILTHSTEFKIPST